MGAARPEGGGCQAQRVHWMGLLGLLLNDAFITSITPRVLKVGSGGAAIALVQNRAELVTWWWPRRRRWGSIPYPRPT